MKVAQTEGMINAPISEVWDKVCFYEEVKGRPNWLLRRALPLPVRTIGDHKTVGTLCCCEYSESQYILKRITRSVHDTALEFSVTEASEQFERHISLKGGAIVLSVCKDGKTRVTMTTHYTTNDSQFRLRHLLFAYIIRAMHRFVIRDMANSIERAHELKNAVRC